MLKYILILIIIVPSYAQHHIAHLNAHAHNDYVHRRPLKEALENGFISVEADIHLVDGKILVAHNHATNHSPELSKLYLAPLDSILKAHQGQIYPGSSSPFYLMIDLKTEGEATYRALKELLGRFSSLLCRTDNCAVKIFLSGERPEEIMLKDATSGIAIDGRPEDIGKGHPARIMPVISDTYKNWSDWRGNSAASENDLARIKALAQRVHAEGKKLRLYGIPDKEIVWQELLNCGVDLINTDHLEELNMFLQKKGL